MKTDLVVFFVILVGESAFAAHHMGFSQVTFSPGYARTVPIFRDVWHIASGFAHLPVAGMLCFLAYGYRWHWWAGAALGSWICWQAMKIVHGKRWGWGWLHYWIVGGIRRWRK
jgi:hypothetical protein